MLKKFAPLAIMLLLVVTCISACNVFASESINTGVGPTTTLCPAMGTARAAVMPPLASGNHANLIYTTADPTSGDSILRRFDTITHKTVDITHTPNANILKAQISPDGQWVMFLINIDSPHQHVELRMVRMDGQYQQTLFCLPTVTFKSPYQSLIGNFAWSPDVATVAVIGLTGKYQLPAIYMVDIAQGQVQTELESTIGPMIKTSSGTYPQYAETYIPVKWLDGTHLYVQGVKLPASTSAQMSLYLLDTGKGANQQNSDLQQVLSPQQMASKNKQVCDFDSSSDGSQLFTLFCPSGGISTTPPTSIAVQPDSGGSATTILSSNTLAITSVRVASAHTLLLLVRGAPTDSQNGIWKVNTDGSGLKRISAYSNPSFCGVTLNNVPCDVASRDGTLYAMVAFSATSSATLNYGSLSGGKLTQVATLDALYAYFVGWTTIS